MEISATPFFIIQISLHLQTSAIDYSADYLIFINMEAQLEQDKDDIFGKIYQTNSGIHKLFAWQPLLAGILLD